MAVWRLILCVLVFAVGVSQAVAIDKGLRIFRVGTGPSISNSYLTGITLANSISKPAGSISCEQSGLCGVPGLIALTQTQNGFIDSIAALDEGQVESVLVPANIAYWAYSGSGEFASFKSYPDLRVFASIKPELLHLVVRADRGIDKVSDLAGRRVYLGWERSGIQWLASRVLGLNSVGLNDVHAFRLDPNQAFDALVDGEIDAAFFMESIGTEALSQLLGDSSVKLISLGGVELLELQAEPFINLATIPVGAYSNSLPIATVGVNLLWLTKSEMEADLVGQIVRALWNNEAGVKRLKLGHLENVERARLYMLDRSIDGIPLHVGALGYFEKLVRFQESQNAGSAGE